MKVIEIPLGGLNYEGITNVIYNYTSNLKNFELSFCTYENTPVEIKNKFNKIGKIFYLKNRKKNLLKYMFGLYKIIKKEKYDVAHIHGNSSTMGIEAFVSKIAGVKNVICHCHNSKCDHKIINILFKPIMKIFSNKSIACSEVAGNWIFDKKFIILKNGVDFKKFYFNSEMRFKFRKEFDIKDDEIVIGYVGNFTEQKNHEFLLEVFCEICKKNNKYKLLLVGDGHLRNDLEKQIKQLKIQNNVIFAGRRSDVNNIYNAMDLFLLCSLWEGFGMVNIEAQVNGLQCFVSDRVPDDVILTPNIEKISLEKHNWVDKITNCKIIDIEKRNLNIKDIERLGEYDISRNIDNLTKIYNNRNEKKE